ncbi:hypothetical protein A8L34_14125 [Bacillus sp. FJAT-27264]|uniref:sensor histidine kinase n=1 Tax=Paenibacillus sp. (strain DSM 101736 / FJAT-27264) TaxID=1850362 RepID=UPI0008080B2A|nr:HAMP domain-containing sensor histidine kinase [Bacillus sp. FJAT-27264]OBZ15013.1 hypothetical protein A8L34_14125 [Bacillus sp. FJAT-27264]
MYWRHWFKTWFISVLICIFVIVGCSAFIYYKLETQEHNDFARYTVNQARVEVSEIMFFLEQQHSVLSSQQDMQDKLLNWSQQKKLDLVYAGLDGTVLFDSSRQFQPLIDKLDLKNSVHYDLHASKTNPGSLTLAFPVIDPVSKRQTGNAIFTLPEEILDYEQPTSIPIVFPVLMVTALIVLLLLLFQLKKRINSALLRPINRLKDHSEAILRGNYEQKAEYVEQDEIGEVYAVFDQMRQEIMELSQQRDAQNKAQKELISNISHDLKTPLTTVKAYIDAIQDGICPDLPAIMEYMEIMQSQTNKMAVLVEDLLVHALRDLGQISVTLTECYSKEVFESILRPIGPYIRTTGVNFIEAAEIPNVLIRIDPVRLEQLISNLTANALKHTSAGDSISIEIVQQQDQLKVTVSDTGEGIHPQDMPFIFERYFQGQAPPSYENRLKDGSGLGLSICKHIIEAHQGTISFKSVKHQGSAFYFTLPLC